MPKLYREDMDTRGCEQPGCDCGQGGGGLLYLHSSCHPSSPTWTRYLDGVLTIVCDECEKEVASFVVASRAQAHGVRF